MKGFGPKVKEYRGRNNMTLRGLATKINVSASFLSQIEKGKAFPSFANLLKIADALKISVGMLIEEDQNVLRSPVVRKNERRSFEHAGKGMTLWYLTHPNNNNEMEAVLHVLQKNGNSGNTMNNHFGQEFVFIQKGSLEIRLEDAKYILNEGDSICFNSNIPHKYRNIFNGMTEALWVVLPPQL